MHVFAATFFISVSLIASVACGQPFSDETIDIAKDKKGIGFDDLRYSPWLHRVLVPAGRTGTIVLIDPANHHTSSITGLSTEESYGGGHGEGTTSVDEGEGALYATDRTSKEVVIIDPAARRVTSRAALGGSPDYVRYVGPTHELWVTQPDAEQIEIFSISPRLAHVAYIRAPGGPESLVIDGPAGRAYTHLWSGTSVVIDIKSRSIIARWPNQCKGSRGIAYTFYSPLAPRGRRWFSTLHTTEQCLSRRRPATASTSLITILRDAISIFLAPEAQR